MYIIYMIKSRRPATWHSKASKFVTWWLVLLVIAGLVHPILPNYRWVLIHLFTLGALTNSIMLWSSHFTDKWLHTTPRHSPNRFYLLNAGILATVLGQLFNLDYVTALGASGVTGALLWQLVFLFRQYRSDQRFSHSVLAYLLSAVSLIMSAVVGAAMAFSPDPHLLRIHLLLNFGGFVGLAALGSLAVLFPAMWRTKIVRDFTKPALLICTVGLALSMVNQKYGIFLYALGWALALGGFLTCSLKKPSFPAISALLSMVWLIGSLIKFGVTDSLPTLGLLVGFAAQLLIGTMSYLLPTTIGGGPAAVRAGLHRMNEGGLFRTTLINGGLLVWIFSDNSWLKVAASLLVCASLGWLLVAMPRAVKDQKAKRPVPEPEAKWHQVTAGIATLTAIAVLLGGTPTPVTPTAGTGHTTTVDVMIHGMDFVPQVIDVPKGDRLVLNVTNHGDQVHDLTFANGATTSRIEPGATATVDAGVIAESQEAWCSIAGHRMQGMTLQINTDDSAPTQSGPEVVAKQKPVAPDHSLVPAELSAAPTGTIHDVTIDVQELEINDRGRWTFNGGLQGPVLRGKVGDEFRVTFTNSGSMAHSIDFHAGQVSPDEVMRSINPGETLQYNFRANYAGIWLYHCGTMPMSMHVAAGMYGAVIIDPPNLAPVDQEFLIVQSEVYGLDGTATNPVDAAKLAAGEPDAVVFNGWEDQYVATPLQLKAGQTARFWLLNAGPNRSLSFHIVGSQFHTMYKEGAYTLKNTAEGGGQALDLLAAQGGFVEASFPEAGTYTMVNHQFIDAERGARGKIVVR
ncbi:multicopper oxidase domain-containing protein [Corynebacterium sp. H130]|uniref:multicopper oxidase domain-containing protein n=1 Tax=Corynebacterium sp. H130 TaxID=3133444 RepID=UPI0030AE5A7D